MKIRVKTRAWMTLKFNSQASQLVLSQQQLLLNQEVVQEAIPRGTKLIVMIDRLYLRY